MFRAVDGAVDHHLVRRWRQAAGNRPGKTVRAGRHGEAQPAVDLLAGDLETAPDGFHLAAVSLNAFHQGERFAIVGQGSQGDFLPNGGWGQGDISTGEKFHNEAVKGRPGVESGLPLGRPRAVCCQR